MYQLETPMFLSTVCKTVVWKCTEMAGCVASNWVSKGGSLHHYGLHGGVTQVDVWTQRRSIVLRYGLVQSDVDTDIASIGMVECRADLLKRVVVPLPNRVHVGWAVVEHVSRGLGLGATRYTTCGVGAQTTSL